MLWTIVEILLSTTAISLYHIYFILICSKFTFSILCKFTFYLFQHFEFCLSITKFVWIWKVDSPFIVEEATWCPLLSSKPSTVHLAFPAPGSSSPCARGHQPYGNLGPLCELQFSSRPLVQSIRPSRPCSQPPIEIEALCPFLRAHLHSRPLSAPFSEASARTLHFNVSSSTTSLIIFCFSHTLFSVTYTL